MNEAAAPVIEIRGLSRRYAMGDTVVHALEDATLTIRRGEFVMIVGSSGSGKSTLMHLLGCLDRPTSGSYRLDGIEVSQLADEELSQVRNQKLGFVFQRFNLLPGLTVQENIAVPLVYAGTDLEVRAEAAARTAGQLGLTDRLRHRPTELSGGQCQRVAIARALVNRPEILFADEPTGNLDSVTGREIMGLLFELNAQGYTVIMVTHDPELAGEGTRKITLRDGRIETDLPGRRVWRAGPARRAAATVERAATVRSVPVTRGGRLAAWVAQLLGGVNLLDLARVGLREGLLAHKLRTALTMLGIVIAVAGVIAMSSFSLGSKKKQENQIKALGVNQVRVIDSQHEGEKLTTARKSGSPGLSLDDVRRVRQDVPGVEAVAAVRNVKLNMGGALADLGANVSGVSGDYEAVNNLRVGEGRFLDAWDEAGSVRVAVIGWAVRDRLGPAGTPGNTILLGGQPYTIVGVLKGRDVDIKGLDATGARDVNFDILIPLRTLLTRTRQIDLRSEIDELQVRLVSDEVLYRAGSTIRRIIQAAHCGVDDFRLVVPLELLKQKQQSQRLLDVLTLCIAGIALLVGGIGIMNIMLANVTERTREIGVRRAVGASERGILQQFLSEAVLISVTGGLAGMTLAVLVVLVVCPALQLPIVFSPWIVLLAVTAAIGTGLVFGLYPARQAARMDPVEALRYE
jgi:macrolide transport system ATP-binding/permease protein